MAALPYMQLYVADYLADTTHLNAAQHGAYLLLLMNYWQRGRPLPDSNDRLAIVARMSNDEWNANREVIAEFFQVEDGEWKHDRVERDLRKVKGISDAGRVAGLASARARKQKASNDRSKTVEREFNHTDTDTDKKQKMPTPAAFLLPQWIDKDAWAGFEEMRKKIRAPLTDRARNGIIKELQTLCAPGDSGADILDQSTQRGWRSVFPLKSSNGTQPDPLAAMNFVNGGRR